MAWYNSELGQWQGEWRIEKYENICTAGSERMGYLFSLGE